MSTVPGWLSLRASVFALDWGRIRLVSSKMASRLKPVPGGCCLTGWADPWGAQAGGLEAMLFRTAPPLCPWSACLLYAEGTVKVRRGPQGLMKDQCAA